MGSLMVLLGVLSVFGLIMMVIGSMADKEVINTIGAIVFILSLLTLCIWKFAIFVMRFQ